MKINCDMYEPDPKRPGRCIHDHPVRDFFLFVGYFALCGLIGCALAYREHTAVNRNSKEVIQNDQWPGQNLVILQKAREQEKSKQVQGE